jgi:hypothetical protein
VIVIARREKVMKAAATVMQTFALNNEGRIVHVDEVPRGGDCGCRCPACDGPLIARQGEIRGWHFAHRQDADCETAVETSLHRAAKQLLHDEPGLMLPGLLVSETWATPAGVRHSGAAMIEPCWIDFDQVLLEPTVGLIRPDAIALQGSRTWIVEIRVHHAVDARKREIIASIGWPAFEIILDPLDCESWTPESLRRELVDRHDNKQWLNHPERAALVDKAREAARAQAVAQAPCPNGASPGSRPNGSRGVEPIRHRYKVRDMIVDATERDFAITVWSSFHPEVTPMVTDLCRRLGGSWRRQYRNWVVSHLQRDALLDALAALSRTGGLADWPGPG